jgi:hypothetical protein
LADGLFKPVLGRATAKAICDMLRFAARRNLPEIISSP